MNRTSRRTRIATAALLAPLALGLVACGGDDDADDAPITTTSGDVAPSGSAAPTIEGDVETAAQTALAEVDGTVFSVDHDGMGWDVTVVTADGVENDLELSADASSVARGPVEDTDSDADDAAEREMLLGASVDYAAAIEAATAEAQGTVTGVDLSEENGAPVWEVQLDEDTPNEVTVEIDAESGEVLRVEQGD